MGWLRKLLGLEEPKTSLSLGAENADPGPMVPRLVTPPPSPPAPVARVVAAPPAVDHGYESDPEFDYWMDQKLERLELAGIEDGTWFYSSVAGVTFPNADGTSRQDTLAVLEERAELRLKLDGSDARFPDAVAIYATGKRQVGFVRSHMAKEVKRDLERGMKFRVFVSAITGGSGHKSYGCNIAIMRWTPLPL